MAAFHKPIIFLLSFFLYPCNLLLLSNNVVVEVSANDDIKTKDLKIYTVHIKNQDGINLYDDEGRRSWHNSLLQSVIVSNGSSLRNVQVIHSYGRAANGFSALLNEQELEIISKQSWFLHAYKEPTYELHTTYSPDFLDLRRPDGRGVWNISNMGEGIIIGVIDTGITADHHPSFDDDGMPPPPSKWKGSCELPNKSSCNKKLIGAFSTSFDADPTSQKGHGTHTASTAAGAFVRNISFNAIPRGIMSGMAPRAHLSIYKACHADGCHGISSATEQAIKDGVDVISMSIGDPQNLNIYDDSIAIGSFQAVSNGIIVVCSAGNSGASLGTVNNIAPWILTVASSRTNRRLVATVKLGNGQEFEGQSLFQPFDHKSTMLPIVYAGDNGKEGANFCLNGTLDGLDVKGKIVLCEGGVVDKITKGKVVQAAGAMGLIIINRKLEGYNNAYDAIHVLPTSQVTYDDGIKIKDYLNSTKNSIASIIFKGHKTQSLRSPGISHSSSRGPSTHSPQILKPDITAPGINILAAWTRPEGYIVASGTSMATPHIAGVAALIKKAHPNWSPAAIKSAIMTTSYTHGLDGKPIVDLADGKPASFYAMGAGHVNPLKALDPGLIYDITMDDYVKYLCGVLPSEHLVTIVVMRDVNCETIGKINQEQLNYPAISVSLNVDSNIVTVTRTMTNVGEANSLYRATIEMPTSVSITLQPQSLVFMKVNEKKSFTMTFKRNIGNNENATIEGNLKWVSNKHVVRSPILVTF